MFAGEIHIPYVHEKKNISVGCDATERKKERERAFFILSTRHIFFCKMAESGMIEGGDSTVVQGKELVKGEQRWGTRRSRTMCLFVHPLE